MNTDQIKNLLEKYKQGTCTVAEKEAIDQWLAEINIDNIAHFNDDFIDVQLKNTKLGIDTAIGEKQVVGRIRQISFMQVAATLLVMFSVIATIWAFRSKKQTGNPVASQPGVSEYIKNGWVYVQTKKGVIKHLNLADGSRITLDASSRLRYPVKFINHKRPIYLDEGEALFDVAKDKTSPFTVYTNKFATTALGTAFNIRSYAGEHKVSISLIHGKIRVDDLHPASKAITKILMPHQQIVLNKQSGTLIKSNFDDETPITSWKDGVLSFKDASTDEVLNAIENHFNVVIVNKSNRVNWSYTGDFKDESLADVLKTVCLTEGINCSINKNNVTLN